jgi:hypothetical protein
MSRPFPSRRSTSRASGDYVVAGRSLRDRSLVTKRSPSEPSHPLPNRAGLRSRGPVSPESPPNPSQSSSDFERIQEDRIPLPGRGKGRRGGKSIELVPATDPMEEEDADGDADADADGDEDANGEDEVNGNGKLKNGRGGEADNEFDPGDEPEPDPADDDDYKEGGDGGGARVRGAGFKRASYTSRSGRPGKRIILSDSDEEPPSSPPPTRSRSRTSRTMKDFVEEDEDDDEEDAEGDYGGRARRQRSSRLAALQKKKREEEREREQRAKAKSAAKPFKRTSRNSRKALGDDDLYEESDEEEQGTAYAFRKRGHISYKIPTVEDIAESSKSVSRPRPPKRAPFNMTGRQLGRLFGEKVDDSSVGFCVPSSAIFFGIS